MLHKFTNTRLSKFMNMISPCLIVLYLVSVFSDTSAFADANTTVNEKDYVDKVPLEKGETQFIFVGSQPTTINVAKYASIVGLESIILDLEKRHMELVKVWSLGQSVGNNTIYAVQISRNVREPRKIMKPMFKYVANIHGTDVVGYGLMVSFIQYLVYSDNNDRINKMLDTIDIWIVPTMNPDSINLDSLANDFFISRLRETLMPLTSNNGNGVDLDTDFPTKVFGKDWVGQPETRVMLQFIMSHPFVLSANIQGGDLAVAYPWDNGSKTKKQHQISLTDDNEFFVKVAKSYASRNPKMSPNSKCNKVLHPDGIVNGCFRRRKRGSMQDANYILTNCFEVTLYLSCAHQVYDSDLPKFWNENVNALLNLVENTRQGVYGLVQDTDGQPIKDAVVRVIGKRKVIKVTENGEYWRLLVWGLYSISASAPGYLESIDDVKVSQEEPYVQHNITLRHQGVHGRVRDMNDQPIKEAVLKVEDRDKKIIKVVKGNELGEYGETLVGKDLKIIACAPGYAKTTENVQTLLLEDYVQLDFQLKKSKYNLGMNC